MSDLLTLDEALAHVLARAAPLEPERVPVAEAAGRVVAEPARAVVDLPPFPSSAMDGFAVRAEDTPGRLPVIGRVAAGRPLERSLAAGEAAAIATGGVVPDGADAVIPLEYVVDHDNEVETPKAVARGANVRPRAGDVAAGTAVVGAGARLAPARLAALAAAGVAEVRCARRPRVFVVGTGTELRAPGQPLAAGEIYEANVTALVAAVRAAGAVVTGARVVADDAEAHREALRAALDDADVVVTSGGVSVGPHDLVRRALLDLGVEEVFWRVAVKPGKPVSFGVRGRTLVFGLPGNPVSTLVGFELFVRPALARLQGEEEAGPRFEPGRLSRAVRRNRSRDELVRARADVRGEHVLLEPLGGQESHMIVAAAAADALVHVPRGEGELAAGAAVRYLRLA